jgi:periplasmic copper chaperone A
VTRMSRSVPWLVTGAALALLLAACGGADDPAPVTDDAGDAADVTEDIDAEDEAAASITVTDVRSRMSPRMVGVAAVYLDIDNAGDTDDVLVSASVPTEVAGLVELHETFEAHGDDDAMADDEAMGDEGMADDDAMGDEGMADDDAMGDEGMEMMGMREVESIEIPAGATVELVPGGLHIMLLELVEDLAPGDTFELTLDFEQAGAVTTMVEVREDV